MRRLILGLTILGLLLLAGAGISIAMERIHSPIAETLSQAAEAAQAKDWAKAKALAESAGARWEAYWLFTAAVADHTPMDEIDSGLAELKIYLAEEEMPHFAATAKQLQALVEAMAGSHSPAWWNFI